MILKTKYCNEPAVLHHARYGNGSPALQFNSEDGQPLLRATIALNRLPDEGNVIIKNWSENEGIMECLIELGIIGPILKRHETGFVEATEHKLLVTA